MNIKKESLKQRLYECNQHKKRILVAKKNLNYIMPLTKELYHTLSTYDMSFIDQMIFRFSKLQDVMGEKLFPNILELLEETIKDKSFIDRLNRLEELRLVVADEWITLRKVRNDIAHEYSSNQDRGCLYLFMAQSEKRYLAPNFVKKSGNRSAIPHFFCLIGSQISSFLFCPRIKRGTLK